MPPVDKNDPNRHLPEHERTPYCVESVCRWVEPKPSLFDEEATDG